MQGSAKTVLTDQMLARFAERGARYDRENLFFQEDFDELKAAGYFKQCVPRELGGAGLTLAEYCQDLRRLAYHAPATALATNMHQYWVGLVADLWRAGDKSLEWLLTETLAGEIFAAGHAETGNDIPVLLSTTKAERTQGGYKFTGRKSFGSMTPVWTRLGIHGMDTTDPANPRVVHAFLPRDAEGFRVEKTWDHVLGMRATRSDDTILQGAVVPEKYVARVVAPGAAGVDGFVLGIFAWALVGFGNVYYAMARRAFDLTVDRVKSRPRSRSPVRWPTTLRSSTRWRRWRWSSRRSNPMRVATRIASVARPCPQTERSPTK